MNGAASAASAARATDAGEASRAPYAMFPRHRPLEQEDVLLDNRDEPPVALEIDLANVDPVELDEALGLVG